MVRECYKPWHENRPTQVRNMRKPTNAYSNLQAWNLGFSFCITELLWLHANEFSYILIKIRSYWISAFTNIRRHNGANVVNCFRCQASLTVWTFFSCHMNVSFHKACLITRCLFSRKRKKVIRPSEQPLQPFGSRQTLTCWIWRWTITCHYSDQEILCMTWFWPWLRQPRAFTDRSVAGVFCAPHMLEACSVKSSVC